MEPATNPRLVQWCLDRLKAPLVLDEKVALSDRDDLTLLSVIVPSYGRQDFLLRQLVYWHGTSVELYVLDGSPTPIPGEVVAAFEATPDRHYIHAPTDSIITRLKTAAGMLTRPYAVLLGDDEFHLLHGLRQAIGALRSEQGYAGCIGQSLRFFLSSDRSSIGYGKGYAHHHYRADHDNLEQRLTHAMKCYNAATCYAVLTREAWRRSWGALVELSCKDTWELQQALSTYMRGKFLTVEEIYWMRSDENVSISDRANTKDLNFSQWWKRGAYGAERQKLLDSLMLNMDRTGSISTADGEQVIVSAIEVFHDVYLEKNRPAAFMSMPDLRRRLVDTLRWVLPKPTYQILRSWFGGPRVDVDPLEHASLGSLPQLSDPSNGSLFRFDEQTRKEIYGLETLIKDFYEAASKP